MILLDTSVLVDAVVWPRRSLPACRAALERGEPLGLSALVLYEWLRGPRTPEQLSDQERLLPAGRALPFEASSAAIAASLYRKLGKVRGREVDLAIAASAIEYEATLWTLNLADFRDIPGLAARRPPSPT